eukprot:CAMPEP_0119109922 /NCGR_PEP_ID=MMETSP1180-20130426/24896_1 /TAXON_ID=3052 ORGANISM="Chlamydomonas cf sp, Strain CCMP681" /NCGR_SAMPLE_ID=MMETSP1180 /ASSEMBLY_ACC=CAM_ASM_000741 /LENGTH=39 /DNA_ID= /DNA_START= /DNA_END= /DNA_ORIENTATION=
MAFLLKTEDLVLQPATCNFERNDTANLLVPSRHSMGQWP